MTIAAKKQSVPSAKFPAVRPSGSGLSPEKEKVQGIIRIKDLSVRCIVGIKEDERANRQEVLVNAELEFDPERAISSDDIGAALNYRTITKRIIHEAEGSEFFLLESLAAMILRLIMEDPLVLRATVEVDKPHALRFARSVSVQLTARR